MDVCEHTDDSPIIWDSDSACTCLQTALVGAKSDKGVMGKALRKAEALLRDMVGLTLRADLTRIQRTNLETCITVHMHQKESTGSNPPSASLCFLSTE
jgi:hypothetical protein